MADNTPIDPFKTWNISLNPDGTLTRGPHPLLPETIDPDPNQTVTCTDIPLNPTKNTYIRVYQPLIPPSTPKLPLIIYFHGGGFIVFNVSSPHYHEPNVQMASEASAIILAVEFALAPENRLPSAYEDALEAILWVQTQAFKAELEYEFFQHVDLTKCFLMGSSAGANIVYQVALQATNLEQLEINGLIMNQLFISGVERTESELRLANDLVLPTVVNDLMWELSLPLGANRDHEYCNPIKEDAHKKNADILKKLPRCYVRGHGGDPALDRQKMFVKMLEDYGVCVVKDFSKDGLHGSELFDPIKAKELIAVVKGFIYS